MQMFASFLEHIKKKKKKFNFLEQKSGKNVISIPLLKNPPNSSNLQLTLWRNHYFKGNVPYGNRVIPEINWRLKRVTEILASRLEMGKLLEGAERRGMQIKTTY